MNYKNVRFGICYIITYAIANSIAWGMLLWEFSFTGTYSFDRCVFEVFAILLVFFGAGFLFRRSQFLRDFKWPHIIAFFILVVLSVGFS